MSVELVVEPGRVVTWDEFILESAQRDVGSIGLDGYVYGKPQFTHVTNHKGEIIGVQNFNHHEEVGRLATYATCGQVELALVNGLDVGFHDKHGRFAATLRVNDSDQDVCAAVWLFRNKHLVEHGDNPAIGRFVRVANLMDMTAGSYPFNKDLPFLETLNWINGPYNHARLSGEISSRDPKVHIRIIDEVGSRIDRYVMGAAGAEALDYRFETVDKNHNWIMIKEKGAQGKKGAIDQGNNVIITIRDQDPERLHVSFWRRSEWVKCDFPGLINALNIAELKKLKELGLVDASLAQLDPNTGWGGGDTTFGSPRAPGTKLSLQVIGEIADEYSEAL
jgi:hypothetical protein